MSQHGKDSSLTEQQIMQVYTLEPETELRFEVEAKNAKVELEMKCGLAEVFGTELVKGKKYTFKFGSKIGVFTWHGCTLELRGKADGIYVAKETPLTMYLNVHTGLEQLRAKAEREKSRGPVALVVGPSDVGKSTLCRMLLNYAVRMGRSPIYLDLDISQGAISVPGTMGAVLVERPASVEDGFSQQAPLIMHYGHTNSSANLELYNQLVTRMSDIMSDRMQANKKANNSGMIINTGGWVMGDGYRQLIYTAKAFEVDLVLVLDQERVYNDFVRDMPSFVQVVLLPKSGGAVERNSILRSEARDQQVREYFYGQSTALHPHSFDVPFRDLRIYKIGALALPDSCMPHGMKAEDKSTKLVAVAPGMNLLHHLLGISFCPRVEDDVVRTNLAGYICVTNVDMENQMLTVLSPQNRPLPKTIFLLSDVQYVDAR